MKTNFLEKLFTKYWSAIFFLFGVLTWGINLFYTNEARFDDIMEKIAVHAQNIQDVQENQRTIENQCTVDTNAILVRLAAIDVKLSNIEKRLDE